MGFIAGWFGTGIDRNQASELAESLKGCAPESTKKTIGIRITDSFVLVSDDKRSLEQGGCRLALTGHGFGPLEAIVENYKAKGADFIKDMQGAFTLMFFDESEKRLLLATDRLGQNNLYYAQTPNGIVFGSTADSVVAHPEVSSEISRQSIYDYVYFHHCPSPHTIYRQVQKLEGGQLLTYQDGKIALQYYWMPVFSEQGAYSLEKSGQELRNEIIEAVRQSAADSNVTGAFLSGGLDSSSVAGALSKVYPEQAKTFTMGFPVEGYDEIEYARIAVDCFKTRPHEYYVTPEDTVAAVPKIAAFYDEPFGNSSALAAYYCAKLAKENGIQVMLAGDGGDELFAGNERYAKQLLFDRYYRIPGFARTFLRTGLYNAPDALLKNKILFKAKRYVEQAEVPLPDRLQDYNFLNRHPAQEIFTGDFLAGIDIDRPIQSLRDCYHRPENASALNRMLYMDWKTTLHDNDLVKVNRMCEMVGVEVRYPLLTNAIVDLSCRVPSSEKLKGQQLRWFYKQAMRGFLPEAIINKSKHGFGLPFGIWLQDHQPLKELAYDSIGALKKRDYFRTDFLDHAVKMHQSIHAAYYGELIWILMMLELWFQAKNHH
ncbi:asparagine synthetase B family protein [Methylotuvimicrobium buryatense]|uniref:asparagine synthase (glutamine-hydrolyzing) n=1 Tax=Methylotuvimicrobium buryatense TaxID=95641 RepID=A0A4P9ULM2_METBY|nr:asparagine synthase C-terminal domain-containing protein [Methylotuvimicrobium buryatense]QCW82017.1 asparagine synthase [Methylotuvimicrobium buryatense]